MHFILFADLKKCLSKKMSQVYLSPFKKLSPGFSGDLTKEAVSKKSDKLLKECSKKCFNSK